MGSHLIQLLFALLASMTFFLVVKINFRFAFTLLILLIPFQIISSRYGSINFALSIVFWAALLLSKQNRIKIPTPLILSFFLIILAMLPALYWTPGVLWRYNGIYIINFAQNVIMIMLVINYARDEESLTRLLYILGIGNILVIAFFFIQAVAGQEGIAIADIQEFKIHMRTAEKQRLLGPFGGTQFSVTYLIFQSMICIYAIQSFAGRVRNNIFWFLLLIMNTGLLIGTGTRSGFIGFVIGLIFMFVLYAPQIGFINSLKIATSGTLCLVIMTFVLINFTQYNTMLDRLEGTKVYGLEVDTRKGLIPLYWEEIIKHPIVGNRPMLSIPDAITESGGLKQNKIFIASPPHNFYIYALFTTGVVGLSAHLLFFGVLFFYLLRAKANWQNANNRLKFLPTLLIAILILFLIMQFFVSYIRFGANDFQDYMFVLFGIMISTYNISQQSRRIGDNA